jgi:hypothetical protein
VHNTAPPVEDEPTDPTEAVLTSLQRNWMMLPMAYNTKPTSYTGVRTVLLRAEPSAAELTPALHGHSRPPASLS